MKRTIAIVGRPNVGKSTLFNRLTKTRQALVADIPGVTRDRIYGRAQINSEEVILIDTAGIADNKDELQALMSAQSEQAMAEADGIVFLVDGRAGLSSDDEKVARMLRRLGKPLCLAVNKTEGMDENVVCAEFHRLGLGAPLAVSAEHGEGIRDLCNALMASMPKKIITDDEAATGIKIALAGRPNVGKSTLANRMLGEERVLVFDQAGTTRDSIYIPFERDGQAYTLIDTAGVRRRSRVDEVVEKISVNKTLQAIDDAHVVILVIDGSEGVTDQDATLSGFILEAGRALVIAINKWDGLTIDQRDQVRNEIALKLHFLDFAKIYFISALHGTGVGEMYPSIHKAYESAMAQHPTPILTRLLEAAIAEHQPPLVRGRRIKLRYAHQGGVNPPLIIVHGNQTVAVPDAYARFLANYFRRVLHCEGAPMRVEFRGGVNPFEGKRNELTKRQIDKKRRLQKFVKRKK